MASLRTPSLRHRRWRGIATTPIQDMLIRKVFRRAIAGPRHYVPTAEGFGAAVRAGLGWGMYPEQLAAAALADGSFVRDLRRTPRRAAVLAVLEARQPDHQDRHRSCAVSRCESASAPEVVAPRPDVARPLITDFINQPAIVTLSQLATKPLRSASLSSF